MEEVTGSHGAAFGWEGRVPAPLCLTREELKVLTSTVQPKRMCAWLTDRGWIFENPSRRGDIPKVDRAYYLARMSGQRPITKRAGPRLDFMLRP